MDRKQKKQKQRWKGLLAAVLLMGFASSTYAQEQENTSSNGAGPTRDLKAELANKIKAPFTIAAVGDIIEPEPISSIDPRFQALVEQFHKADIGFANMESSLVDFRHFQGPVGGTEAPIEMGAAMKAMGITLVNHANNHALNGDLGGEAGENDLRLTAYQVVTPEQLQQMKSIAASVYGHGEIPATTGNTGPERFKYFDSLYQAGSNPGAIAYEMNRQDERDILTSIRNGKIYADFMIVTIHAHQLAHFSTNPIAEVDDHDVPDFLPKLAHESVDNGADMFVVQGVHDLRGIEIYKGKPIFYDVGAFVFQFGRQFGAGYDIMANWQNMARLEKPASEESVLTTTTFDGGNLKEIRLYPVDLGGTRRPISQIGIPMLAGPEDAQRILKELQSLSKPLGTTINIEGNVGVIRVNDDGQSISSAR